MKITPIPSKPLLFYPRYLLALASLALLTLLLIPGDPKNAVFLGFSTSRLAMISLMIAFLIALIFLTLRLSKSSPFANTYLQALTNLLSSPDRYTYSLYISLALILLSTIMIWSGTLRHDILTGIYSRLLPFSGLLLGVSLYAAYFLLRWLPPDEKNWWAISALALLGIQTINWLLYPIPNRYRIFRPQIAFALFLIYLLAMLLIHYSDQWKRIWSGSKPLRITAYTLTVLLLILLAFLFYTGAQSHAQTINNTLPANDQEAYIGFVKRAYDSNFEFTGIRNRTPGYPFFQALFYNPQLTDMQFFARGKTVNIVLSLVCLGLFFLLTKKHLSTPLATLFTLFIAFSFYIFKAGYFQTENAFFFFKFLSFLLLGLMLYRPRLWLALLTGLALGLTFYLKASILPGLIVFALFFFLKHIALPLWQTRSFQSSAKQLIYLAVVLLVFLGIIFPYIQESKQTWGSYFFNINTSYFMWYDDDSYKDDIERYRGPGGIYNYPPDEEPSLHKYFAEHTLPQIIAREFDGLFAQFKNTAAQYNMFNYLALPTFLLLILLIFNRRQLIPLLKRYPWEIAYAFSFILFFLLIFAWYTPIAAYRPRFVMGLYAPYLFCILLAVNTLRTEFPTLTFLKTAIPTQKLLAFFTLTFSFLISIDIVFILTTKLFFDKYGN